MLNILNMEFTRLLKSKCTYIILVLTFLISMLNPAMFKLLEIVENQLSNEISASEELTEEEIAEMEEPLFFGEIEWKCTNMTEANITGCNILLLVTIFAVIFINGELKNGYIKNLTGFAFKRSRLVIANMIIVA
ncbi:MAG: hypothetical protein E7506_07905, partial [Ruminococcus sp.]|nr:hypothetical protein [Ruminococcus sp.]